jgi:hypothetical protein
MKGTVLLVLINGLFFAVNAQAPAFEYCRYLYDGPIIIDVGVLGAPFVTDWNGDGRKDLVAGQFSHGMIRYYENWGEHDNPFFDGFSFLRADDAPIVLPYG